MYNRRRTVTTNVPPPPEGVWPRFLAIILFIAFLFLFTWIGIGVWRFWQESHDRSDKLSDLRSATMDIEDLISQVLNITIPNNCTVVVQNFTQPNRYPDDQFLLFDGDDPTAEVQYNASRLGIGQTVFLTSQNVSGTVAYLADIAAQFSTFQDDTFAVINDPDNAKVMMLNVASVSTSTTRTMTIQDANGTIAYLSDIPTFGSVFLDNAFTVIDDVDNSKRMMLNCSLISSSTTRVMTVQNRNGIIAYLSDLVNATGPPFSDSEFMVYADGDPSARTQLNLSSISTSSQIVMTVQNKNGIIAYLADIIQVVEVVVNVSRTFPDPGFEGTSTLTGLGDLTHIELTFCGGGGGGCSPNIIESELGGGGGSGSGVVDFTIIEPNSKFDSFNITLGEGGQNVTDAQGPIKGHRGNTTTVTGVSSTGFFFELNGYGGEGGLCFTGLNSSIRQSGGGGGGNGGPAFFLNGGAAGSLGGVVGSDGTQSTGSFVACGGDRPFDALFKFPWFGGAGGFTAEHGGFNCGVNNTDKGFQGGGAWQGDVASGGPSIFGPSNLNYESNPVIAAPCAGAGYSSGLNSGSSFGGDGQAVIRYYVL